MSDRDSWPEPNNETTQPLAKKGMSGCLLASLILGGLAFVTTLVCGGLFAWMAVIFSPKLTKVPQEVIVVSRQIFDTDIIEDFSPASARTIDNLLMVIRVADFKHKEGKGELLIASVTVKLGDPSSVTTEQWRPIRGSAESEILSDLDKKKTETHEIQVQGQKVNIVVSEGLEPRDGRSIHLANAEFTHAGTQYIFLIRMDDDIWNQEAVFRMLENAKLP